MRPKHEQTRVGEILELSANPTKEEIERNYKRLVKQYHPDINKDPNAEKALKLINKAYAIAIGKELPPPQPIPQPQQQPIVIIMYTYGSGNINYTFTISVSGGW